jgi:hypothetical protein
LGALDEAHHHRGYRDALEDMTQDVALAQPVQPVLRERRVVRNRVIKIEPTEPPVGEWSLTSSHNFLSERMP